MLKLEITTPGNLVYSGETDIAIIPGEEGEMGVLEGHAPVITNLKTGIVISKDGEEVAARIFVHDGFAEINGQECSVLAAFAQDLAKADKKEIQDNISQAEDRKNKADNDFERDRAQEVIDINQQILEAIN